MLNIHSGEFTYVLGATIARTYGMELMEAQPRKLPAAVRWDCCTKRFCSPSSAHLTRGSYVLLFSDGVTEAMNQAGEQFGRERLLNEVIGRNDLSKLRHCATMLLRL